MTTQTQSGGPLTMPLLAAGGIGVVISLGIALVALMTDGHSAFNTSSDGVVWGLPVAVYVYFATMSSGLALVASLAMVFGWKDFYPIAKRCIWLSIATIIAAFTALALELGHPFRMIWAMPAGMQFASPLFWMGAFYVIALVALAIKFGKMHAGDWDSSGSRRMGNIGLVVEILAVGTLGLAFGAMAMRPFWNDGMMPVYFLVSGFASGLALAVLMTYFSYGFNERAMPERVRALMKGALPTVFAATLALVLVFCVFRTAIGSWSNADGLQVFALLTGSAWFWIELLAGLALPLYLLVNKRTRTQASMQVLAAALVLVGMAIDRYWYVIGGQIVPLFKGAWTGELVQYAPSMTEWMLGLLAVSLVAALYAYGEKALDLGAEPKAG